MLALGIADELPHFRVDLDRLDAAVDLVLATTRKAYPSLAVPFHSRWRHFVVDGADRWETMAKGAPWRDRPARARAELDLAMVSVFLDAGAGPDWRYHDTATGRQVGRSEGLALASLAMFGAGVFSAQSDDPLRADGEKLARLTLAELRDGMQVSERNPLVGLEGRLALLQRLGELAQTRPKVFARNDTPRPGGLLDHLASSAGDGALQAPTILRELLVELGPMWPSRLTLGGVPLGDCWRHPALVTDDATSGLVPLHKLSQWLAYSLIEPLTRAGIDVVDIDGLTGLAEYRNGGLFIDAGALVLRDPADASRAHAVASALVVEWRALTVALLDRLAQAMRERLGLDAQALPLAKVLEGGTWAAGRSIARERRDDGSPPLKVISDGTVF
ncbi:MAG: URC4/urg3 family protein [Hyphomicrobiales bacterium]|nr:URC4/urg3 family protein [Hyphomicrobiales bacterium]